MCDSCESAVHVFPINPPIISKIFDLAQLKLPSSDTIAFFTVERVDATHVFVLNLLN